MTAAMLVARAAMRRQWRGLVVVALLIGIAGGVVLAAAAGARRTSTSLDRFRTFSRSADVELDISHATPSQLSALRRVPAVEAVGVLRQLTLSFANGDQVPSAGSVDDTFGRVVDRPRVIDGRLPRPTSVRDLAISESLASELHLKVGDDVTFESSSPAQAALGATGADPGPPAGPKVTFHIVGLVRRPLDLGVRGGFGGIVIPTPAFVARYDDQIGSFVQDLLRVRARGGSANVPAVISAARRIFGDKLFSAVGVTSETSGARDAIDVLTAALWIFAGVAAIAGVTAVGIVTIRQIGSESRDQEMLAALGLTTRQRVVAMLLPTGAAAVGGGVLAVALAAVASPLLPFGLARQAEVDPGFRFDGLVLGLGLLFVVMFVLLAAAAASWRVARSPARRRELRRTGRPSAVARAASGAGAPPRLTAGLRMALEPGRGPTAVPVRSAFVGAGLGVLGIVAVLVFGASLDHLVASPRLYGWSWDTVVRPGTGLQVGDPATCGNVTAPVTRDHVFAAVEEICLENFEVDGHPVTGYGFASLRGSIDPAIVAGRAAHRTGEVAVGRATLDAIGKKIGDTVRVRGPLRTRNLRIVGQFVLPTLSSDDPEPLADGAAFTGPDFDRLSGPESAPNANLVARFAPGVDPGRLPRTGGGAWKFAGGTGTGPSVPPEIDRLRQVDDLPLILGGLLGLLATTAVGHAVVLATRRRRRELAVLRTIGFERRDVRATIAYQSTVLALLGLLVGIPVGIAVGRVVWRLVADGLGVAAVFDASVVAIALVGVGALLIANLVGWVAATAAIRDRPATVLAAE